MNKSLIYLVILLLCNYTETYKMNIKIQKIQQEKTYNVKKYISNNKLSPFILFTIINNSCKCIMLYHNIHNKSHGNTTLNNFYMCDNHECILLFNNTDNILTKIEKNKDYLIFFNSCKKELSYNNMYFIRIFNKYQFSIIKRLLLFNKV